MDKDNEIGKELSEQIKDTLAGYEEEYVAGAWENFARKQKYILKKEEHRRQRVVFLRYAVGLAACLLLGVIVLNMYQKEPSKEGEQLAGTNSSQIAVIENGSKTDPDQIGKNEAQQTNLQQIAKQQITNRQTPIKKTAALQTTSLQTTSKQITPQQTTTPQTTAQQIAAQQTTTPQTTTPQTATANTPNTPPSTAPQQAIAVITPVNTPADNADNRTARKVRFGINVAQGINSTTTSTAFNYSGGVNVDIPLSKTLALSTGMQIENQSVESKSTVSKTAIPSDNRRASLINLDFPLNIKWKFLSRKSGSYYIAGGISSLAYLSEKYTTTSRKQELREVVSFTGNEPTRTYKLENVETTTTNTAGASNQFDIAGRLNISIGFEKQISPTLYLHIEPFMKIPVSGLASENLIFTTSGITFKISF
ncbi:MAG: outer membrane beta-barrel protein [Bacteroidales bacterium]|jgi:hypothetical protein